MKILSEVYQVSRRSEKKFQMFLTLNGFIGISGVFGEAVEILCKPKGVSKFHEIFSLSLKYLEVL